MKVTDRKLLQAVWHAMVRQTAKGCVDNYFGDRKSLKTESSRMYGQTLHITHRKGIDVPLSDGYLRKRLVRLIESGQLKWTLPDCTFWIDTEVSKDVFDYAQHWWAQRGVMSGIDQDTKAVRCAQVEGFDALALQLEEELLERFGNSLRNL